MVQGVNLKILVIDDLPDNAYTLKEMLEEEGYSVIVASDGLDGISAAINEKPDFIICDIMMPGMNGFKVLEKIRENPVTAFIPFIFLSAKSELSDIREGMQLGADDYIVKPVNRKEILNTIKVRFSRKEGYENKLNELRKSISYSLPHELKTPLVSVLGFSQIIKNDVSTLSKHEIGEMADIIYKSANSLNSLIQKILMFNKLELVATDQIQLLIFTGGSSNTANDFIKDTCFAIADNYKRRDDLIIDIKEAAIKISEPNLKTIISELIDNAFKFSSPGDKVKITGDPIGKTFCIYIINEGIGMTDEQISLLGGYFQADRMLYEQPGVGLGLAISKKIIELHSGELKIESIPGKKTMISFLLPVAEL